jgi:hypothetical protein
MSAVNVWMGTAQEVARKPKYLRITREMCTEYINNGYTDFYWHGPDGEAKAAAHAAMIGTTPNEWGPDSVKRKNVVRVEHPPTRLKF